MHTFLILAFFALGLIIGSFLNVVILRLNSSKSLGGRSACMSCQKKLSWYELIPIFSFFALAGKCKTCKTKISIQYPVVELLTGVVFTLLFLRLGDIIFYSLPAFAITYIYCAFMFSILLVIAVYDLRHKIIPDTLSLLLGVFAFAGLFFFDNSSFIFSPHIPGLWEFLAGPLIALPFAFFWLVSKGAWMGFGDAKLALGIGWLLGIPIALSGIVFAFWSGSIIGLYLVIFKKHKMKSEIPFAPYLVFGAMLAFIFNAHIFFN